MAGERLLMSDAIFVRLGLAIAITTFSGCAASGNERTYVNDEYGFKVKFPESVNVCTALSGSHPVGYYAWLGANTDCEAAKPAGIGSISITAGYNASFEPAPSLASCRDGEAPAEIAIDLNRLAFPASPSVRCAVRRDDGTYEVHVASQGGRQRGMDLPPAIRNAPAVDYNAVLRTNSRRLKGDMKMFRTVLSQTSVLPREAPLR